MSEPKQTKNVGTIAEPPSPSSVDDLELVREREKAPINEFLEQRHPLGGVPGWKACFSARYRGSIVAVVVVGRPVARMADDGTELSITRYCRRDDRPANTGSWLIARARDWARLEGFDTFSANSGVAGNYGTVYEAAGFECTQVRQADGSGWLSHGEDRDTWEDYERRKWVYQLRPDNTPVPDGDSDE
ncbi:XF1762 family protein [Halomicrobium urmianum]|uniref:XF1762 family protein n=1 Tax=Halomicrobium urmianum TaxID=1586233 RepID=UPI001CD92184|nr:XF1762 family protein [Halomicrobium urmianum]